MTATSVPCCDVRYDFYIKTMFGSSLPPIVCRRAHVLFTLFVFAHSCVQHILCCVFFVLFAFVMCLVYDGVQHILCCVCLRVVVSNTYCVVFVYVW